MPHGPDAAGPRNPEGKQNEKRLLTKKTACQREPVKNNAWVDPSNPGAYPQKWWAGSYRARVSWASLPMSWAGLGQDI